MSTQASKAADMPSKERSWYLQRLILLAPCKESLKRKIQPQSLPSIVWPPAREENFDLSAEKEPLRQQSFGSIELWRVASSTNFTGTILVLPDKACDGFCNPGAMQRSIDNKRMA